VVVVDWFVCAVVERKEATAREREKKFFYKPPSVAAKKRDLLGRGLLWMLDVIDTYGGYVMPGGDQAGADKSLPYAAAAALARADRTEQQTASANKEMERGW